MSISISEHDGDHPEQQQQQQQHLMFSQLPEDCILHILEHLHFPLHRYVHWSTLNKSSIKFGNILRCLYGYFPLSSQAHRKVHLLYRHFSLRTPQCHDHRGALLGPLTGDDVRCLQLLPSSPTVQVFTVVSNIFFKQQSLNHTQTRYLLSQRLTGLKELNLQFQEQVDQNLLPLLAEYANQLETLILFGTSVPLQELAAFLIDPANLPGLTKLVVNESTLQQTANENANMFAESIEHRSRLTHLELVNHSCIDNTVVRKLIANKNLTLLDISKSRISDHALQSLIDNTKLKSLILNGCTSVGDAGVNYLVENTTLRHLGVSSCMITQDFDKLLLSETSNIESLVMNGSLFPDYKVAVIPSDKLAPMLPCTRRHRFTRISLSYHVGRITRELVDHLVKNHCHSLKQIQLNQCDMKISNCEPLFNPEYPMTELKSLELDGNGSLSDEFVKLLVQWSPQVMPSLAKLSLNHCQITSEGATALSKHPTITDLSLSYNSEIGDEGMRAFLQNSGSSNVLRVLALQGCGITDAAFVPASDTILINRYDSCLEKLNLYSNKITSVGAKVLLNDNFMPKSLRKLDLTYNKLNDQCVDDIVNNKTLRSLFIKRNKFTQKGTVTLLTKARNITKLYVE